VYLPYLFGTPENWVDIISLTTSFATFVAGLRVLIPMAGMEVRHFDTMVGLILGSFAFTLRTFIGNLVAYLYIQYEGSIERNHYIEYNGQMLQIIDIKSQFVILAVPPKEGEAEKRVTLPVEYCISRPNVLAKKK
jgi:hypothetical protein